MHQWRIKRKLRNIGQRKRDGRRHTQAHETNCDVWREGRTRSKDTRLNIPRWKSSRPATSHNNNTMTMFIVTIRPSARMGLFYNAPEPTRVEDCRLSVHYSTIITVQTSVEVYRKPAEDRCGRRSRHEAILSDLITQRKTNPSEIWYDTIKEINVD